MPLRKYPGRPKIAKSISQSAIRTGGKLHTCHEVEEESSNASPNAFAKAKRTFLFGAQVGVADGADKGVTYTKDKLL
jgi:hypothetical protein